MSYVFMSVGSVVVREVGGDCLVLSGLFTGESGDDSGLGCWDRDMIGDDWDGVGVVGAGVLDGDVTGTLCVAGDDDTGAALCEGGDDTGTLCGDPSDDETLCGDPSDVMTLCDLCLGGATGAASGAGGGGLDGGSLDLTSIRLPGLDSSLISGCLAADGDVTEG